MTCNSLNTNCAPCQDCTQVPVEPCQCKCGNISLPDGRYEHATIVVENGCITVVEAGEIPLYTPNVCCAGTGSGGGGGMEGPEGPKGEPGENATISIGTVSTLTPGSAATVENVGTTTNAILNFGIPAGAQGDSGANPNGVTSNAGGLQIQNGSIVGLPATWPPVFYITSSNTVDGAVINVTGPDASTGLTNLSLNLTEYNTTLREYVNTQIANASTSLQNQINAMNTALESLQSTVTWIQNNCCRTV